MAAAVAIAVLGSLAFIAWMIWRAVKEKSLSAHVVSYGISILAAVFTFNGGPYFGVGLGNGVFAGEHDNAF